LDYCTTGTPRDRKKAPLAGAISMNTDPEHFQNLLRAQRWHNRIFTASTLAFLLCLLKAFELGQSSGWPWLVSSLALLFLSLWSLIEARHIHVVMQIHFVDDK
jgi:hypothetical protein